MLALETTKACGISLAWEEAFKMRRLPGVSNRVISQFKQTFTRLVSVGDVPLSSFTTHTLSSLHFRSHHLRYVRRGKIP